MASTNPVDLTTFDDQQLSAYFMQCLTASDVVEMGRAGMEMTNRLYAAQTSLLSAQQPVQPPPAPVVAAQVVKLKFEKPQPFDGDARHLSDFTFAVEQYLDNIGEQDPVRRQQFASALLTKRALTWWRTKCSQYPGLHATMSFASFLVDLRNDFRDVNHERRTRQALYSLRMQKGNSVQYYIQRFRTLCTELGVAKPDDATCLFQFINGLQSEIRFQLDLDPPVSLSMAELRAEQIYQAIRLRQGAPRFQQTNPRAPTTMSSGDRTPRGAPMVLGNTQAYSRNVQPNSRGDMTCYRCGKKGHTACFCRAPQPLPPRQALTANPVQQQNFVPGATQQNVAQNSRRHVVQRDNNKRSRSSSPQPQPQLKN